MPTQTRKHLPAIRPGSRNTPRETAVSRSRAPAAPRLAPAFLVLAAASALAWTAFRNHPVGDYFTESDFYGGYASGARLIQQGRLDFSRYTVVGPVHEL